MTHPENPEVGGEVNNEPADAREAFENIAAEWLGETGEEEEAPADEADPVEGETDELTEDDIPDEAEADDLPPIEPPVSLSAEDKETFKSLPREAQEFTARRIGELEKGFHTKAQEAARTKQETEQAALSQLAQIEQGYAQHYAQMAQQIMPQRPDPAMIQYDPAGFYAQQANYEGALAQQQQLQQQAQQYAEQAQQREYLAAQAEMQREQQIVAEHFPEYLDPTNGPKLRQELSTVARELGYPSELIEQARAPDILAMRKAAEWKAKADQLDRLNAKKMEKVRAAKGLPKVAKPGAAIPADRARAARADAAWERTKGATNIGDRSDAFAQYLESKGLI